MGGLSGNYPVYRVLYYKTVLDRCLARFFEDFNDRFVRSDDGAFVFSGKISFKMLEKTFEAYMRTELERYVPIFSASQPEFLIVIGSCTPGDNFVLEKIADGDSQRKLKKLIDIAPDIRYFLLESDISLDMRLFNSVFDKIFVDYMSGKRTLGKHVIFLRHGRLDCYFVHKLLRRRYRTMLVDIRKEMSPKDRCILSVNEKIDDMCNRKRELLGGDDVSRMSDEMYRFLDERLDMD